MDQTNRDADAGRALMRVEPETSPPLAPPHSDGEGNEAPVYCEARPVTPEDVAAWYGERMAEAFALVGDTLRDIGEAIRPLVDDLWAILRDDPNVKARERSRADVAAKRREVRRGMAPPPNPLPVATRRGDLWRSPRDRGTGKQV
jgi:hypothetical protein